MEAKSIIILFGFSKTVKAAKSAGYHTINILFANMLKGTFLKATQNADLTIVVNNADEIEKNVARLIDIYHVVAVTSFTDTNDGVLRAAKLNEKYMPNNRFASPGAVELLHNKYATRKLLDRLGMRNASYSLIHTLEEAESFLAAHGEMVLKPYDGQGSNAVRFISEKADIYSALNAWPDYTFIAESVLSGKEYSVETITTNGTTTVLGITEKLKIDANNFGHNPFVERGHIFPATLDEQIRFEVEKYVLTLFNNLEVVNVLGHSEIIITQEGPVLVESHIRAGGDCIPEIVEVSTGLDMFKMHFMSLSNQLGQVEITYSTRAMIDYLILPPGKLNEFTNEYDVQGIVKDRLELELGMKIPPIENSFDRVCGHIICKDATNPCRIAENAFAKVNAKVI